MQKTVLSLALFGCHWLADFTPLSTAWMLHAKRLGKPLFPILIHAGVHGILMSIPIMLIIGFEQLGYLVAFQIVTHFLIDVLKGRINGWFPALQSPTNKWYWILLGADQYLHAIVIIAMIHFSI